MKYKCSCGNISYITYANFYKGKRCNVCGRKRRNKTKTLSHDFVNSYFEENGCTLLDHYERSDKLMRYICECGNESKITWDNFKQGYRCSACGRKKTIASHAYDYEYVKQQIEKYGYTLLSNTYNRSQEILEVRCPKGHEHFTSWNRFQKGVRCKICHFESIVGENSPHWKGGHSELKEYIRNKLVDWKKQSMKSSNYKCIITGDEFNHIHHLVSFNKIFAEVMDNYAFNTYKTVIEYTPSELKCIVDKIIEQHSKYPYGVCLRDDVHNLFHIVYGYGDNTPEQFEEFKQRWLNGEFKQEA
jgi:ribosomal protein S27E